MTSGQLVLTHDVQFLRRFYTRERVMQLAEADVRLLREAAGSDDVFASYGYARWLYYANPHDGALREAEELLFAVKDVIPDALAAYAQMLHYGETEVTHAPLMDIDERDRLYDVAITRGSELAAFGNARIRLFGQFCGAEPQQVAVEIEQRLAANELSDPYWHTLLAYAYEQLNCREDAAEQYELAIRGGELSPYAFLAMYYQERGNIALYEELMEEGLEKGCAMCFIYQADMDEEDFKELPKTEQQTLHRQVDERLHRGLNQGEGLCAYYLYTHYNYGTLGYEEDIPRAFDYLAQGVRLVSSTCMIEQALQAETGLPGKKLSAYDKAELWLKAARTSGGDEYALYHLQRVTDPAFLLKYKDELERYWQPMFPEMADVPDKPVVKEEPATTLPRKTPIDPMVIIIWPKGHLEVAKADVFKMPSYRAMAQELIGGEGLDAVHYSPLLAAIAREVGLEKNLVMYVDRDAQSKNLPDNTVGTLLYGQGEEVRGPIIIAQEDERHECYSFTTEEDLVGTYNEINLRCGGLLIIKDEDDGRYDAFA